MKIYNSISTKTFTSYIFLVIVIKIILLTNYVSAQACDIAPNNPNLNQQTQSKFRIVGFLRQKPPDLNKINWDIYTDIVYAANEFNSPLLGSDGNVVGKTPTADDKPFVKELVAKANTIKDKGVDFNIMLAIAGNYGDDNWAPIFGGEGDKYIDTVTKFLTDYKLDGVDVEFPKPCKSDDLTMGKFADFLTKLEVKLRSTNKFITVTAGPNDQGFVNKISPTTIKRVNVIGYRLNIGLYNPTEVEGPTSPFDDPNNQFLTFKKVAENWKNQNHEYQKNLMMGIELSGIVRKVQNITSSQVVKAIKAPLTFDNGVPITGLCNNILNYMQSVKWVDLQQTSSIFTNGCVTNSSWERIFDDDTKSTYLFNKDQGTYISYEDLESLYYKASFIKNRIVGDQYGGIMISDISADINGDLLSIISYIKSNDPIPPITRPTPSANPANPANPSSTDPNSSSTGTDHSTSKSAVVPTPTDSSDLKGQYTNNTTGIIAGSVIGVLVALVIGFSLLWYYGYKKRQSMSLNKSVNSNDYQNMSVPVSILDKAVPDTPVGRVTALYDFEGKETTDLSFKKGDVIEVIEKGDGANDWWVGKIGSKIGEFPGNYVRE